MKNNKVKLYAKALALASVHGKAGTSAEQGRMADNFLKLLSKAGLERKVKEIVNLAEEIILAKQGNKKIVFETARKMTASQKKVLEAVAKKGDIVKEKINPELIAGVKIVINDSKQFDNSLQSKLQKIL